MRVQPGARSGYQIGRDILPFNLRVCLQKSLDVCFDPLGQSRIGGRVVVGTGTNPGERGAVTVVPVALFVLVVGVVVVSGRAPLHEIGLGELLAHMGGPHRLAVGIDQTAIGLTGKENRRNPAEQDRKHKAAEQQQDQCHHQRLTQAVKKGILIGYFVHRKEPPQICSAARIGAIRVSMILMPTKGVTTPPRP